MKRCSTCKTEKPYEDFNQRKGTKDGYRYECKNCHRLNAQRRRNSPEGKARIKAWRDANPDKVRSYQLKMKYNTTKEQFEAMYLEQEGKCGICRKSATLDKLVVDHDHNCCPQRSTSCGSCIRGLLCGPCNSGIGMLQDSTENAYAAYLWLKAGEGVNK